MGSTYYDTGTQMIQILKGDHYSLSSVKIVHDLDTVFPLAPKEGT